MQTAVLTYKGDQSLAPNRENLVAPLGETTARGVGLLVGQSLVLRVVALVGQIATAWFLDKDDFALFGLLTAILAFTGLIQQAGLTEILVSRQKNFSRWENAAIWISLACGTLSALLTIGVGAVAAKLYHSPSLLGLLSIAAAGIPLTALAVVPTAKLLGQLRFRAVTGVNAFGAAGTTLLVVIFAACGFKAYSFVLPRLIIPAIQLWLLWSLAKPRLQGRPQIRRWRYLARDSILLLGIAVLGTINMQADNLIIGAVVSKRELGAYVFAFSLAVQSITVLTANLSAVLFPVLSKLNDEPLRQAEAFVRSARMLAIIGMPICLLQAALVAPGLHILFASKWDEAVPVVQIASINVAIGLLNGPAISLLQARAQFKALLRLAGLSAILFVGFLTPGAILGGMIGAIAFLTPAACIIAFAYLSKALQGVGQPLSRIPSILLVPLGMSFMSVGLGWAAAHFLPAMHHRDWAQAAVVLGFSAIYLPLAHWACPVGCADIVARARRLAGRPDTSDQGRLDHLPPMLSA